MTEQELKTLLESQPEKKRSASVVYIEDVYETAFGDGKYAYPQRAFIARESANRCTEWVRSGSTAGGKCGYVAEVHEITIALSAAGELDMPGPIGVGSLISLFNGNEADWKHIAAYSCRPGETVPNFGG